MSGRIESLHYFQSLLEESLSLLKILVEFESHSADKPGIDALSDFVALQFRDLGAQAAVLPHPTRGSAVEAVWPGSRGNGPMLILGHLDTVWARGTIHSRPFRIADGRAYGPGVFDMKSGILIALLAARALAERRIVSRGDVRFFFSADEEIGSETSRPHLERAARDCKAVLCLEPPMPGGGAKTFRKGVADFRLVVHGVASHAGVDPQRGASAVLELSRLIVQLHSMTDYSRGITINAGRIHGGSASNVIPDHAEAEVDVRFSRPADGKWVEDRLRGLRPSDPRCTIDVEGGINRPPLERTEAVLALYELARSVASGLGVDLGEGSTGGGSDGSLTAAFGIPTLDGLGVAGDGAHALHEHIEVCDIPFRAALLSGLIEQI